MAHVDYHAPQMKVARIAIGQHSYAFSKPHWIGVFMRSMHMRQMLPRQAVADRQKTDSRCCIQNGRVAALLQRSNTTIELRGATAQLSAASLA